MAGLTPQANHFPALVSFTVFPVAYRLFDLPEKLCHVAETVTARPRFGPHFIRHRLSKLTAITRASRNLHEKVFVGPYLCIAPEEVAPA